MGRRFSAGDLLRRAENKLQLQVDHLQFRPDLLIRRRERKRNVGEQL
jgi:hypothetical protein